MPTPCRQGRSVEMTHLTEHPPFCWGPHGIQDRLVPGMALPWDSNDRPWEV